MWQLSSLNGPLKPHGGSRACVKAGRVAREEACQGLNLHGIVSDSPALRSTWVYLKSSQERWRTADAGVGRTSDRPLKVICHLQGV
jgi:hypothetical protein